MSLADLPQIDSVVFRTRDLAEVRRWYELVLGLRVGTFERDGITVRDADARYVNFQSGNTLIGFETGNEVDRARLVFIVGDLEQTKREVTARGAIISLQRDNWFIVRDPEGREVLLQQRS
ncbi:MAG: VOC family protein [Planctomycetota bacterium]